MDERLERNKLNAKAFYHLMFNECRPSEAMERHVGAQYIQHNPGVGDGKEAFIEYFTRMAAQYPGVSESQHAAIQFPNEVDKRLRQRLCHRVADEVVRQMSGT